MPSGELTVREMRADEVTLRVDYFHEASDPDLARMGVDRSLLPARDEWVAQLTHDLAEPIERRLGYGLLWLLAGEPVGFSTVNKLRVGVEAHMHLHVTVPRLRQHGLGTEFVRHSTAVYFDVLSLRRLFCEPHAFNTAPNRTLQAAGFRYVSTQHTTPGSINFAQVTNLWVLDRPATS